MQVPDHGAPCDQSRRRGDHERLLRVRVQDVRLARRSREPRREARDVHERAESGRGGLAARLAECPEGFNVHGDVPRLERGPQWAAGQQHRAPLTLPPADEIEQHPLRAAEHGGVRDEEHAGRTHARRR